MEWTRGHNSRLFRFLCKNKIYDRTMYMWRLRLQDPKIKSQKKDWGWRIFKFEKCDLYSYKHWCSWNNFVTTGCSLWQNEPDWLHSIRDSSYSPWPGVCGPCPPCSGEMSNKPTLHPLLLSEYQLQLLVTSESFSIWTFKRLKLLISGVWSVRSFST